MASPIAFLVGQWHGSGRGQFPTMDPFDYEEEIRFSDHGVPALIYEQRAWQAKDASLLHFETGIWRPAADGSLAISIALPRVSEISEGTFRDGVIDVTATSVRRAAGGAGLVAVRRQYRCRGDEIDYRIWMATETVSALTHHLEGELRRINRS
jgi:hypothetical protein